MTLKGGDINPLSRGIAIGQKTRDRSLVKKGGKTVKKLKPGTYLVKVADKASDHNFHLKGPGVDKKTSVGKKQNVTWKLKLKKGKYTFVCDPHKSFMKGSFTVG
jgi:plastocyanin